MTEQNDAGLWIVTGLSLSLSEPPPEGEPHPERNPVGPFLSRQAADEWASDYVSQFHSGSWSVAPLYTPQTRGGEVAPGDETPVSEPTSKLPAAARSAATLYDEVHAAVMAEPVGSLARRLHSALGDLAHAVLTAPDPAAAEGPRAALLEAADAAPAPVTEDEVAAALAEYNVSDLHGRALIRAMLATARAAAAVTTSSAKSSDLATRVPQDESQRAAGGGGDFDKALTETRSEYREALDRLGDR